MSYFDVNGVELKEGMFVKVTESKVKIENDIYVVAVDKNVNKQYYKEDAYWLHKVKSNGEELKNQFLLPIKGVTHKRPTTELKIEVVTDLKAAKKDIKEYLNNMESKEVVNQFIESKTINIEVGKVIKIKKPVLLEGCFNKFTGTYEIISIRDGLVKLHLLGKRGNKIGFNVNNRYGHTPILLTFSLEMVEKLFKEYDSILLERVQITKGELKKKKETTKQDKQEEAKTDTENTQEDTKEEYLEVANYTYTVTEDIDTRDDSKIYLVKVEEKLTKDEYIQVNKYIKSLGGYWSRFKHAFLFKEYPKELFKDDSISNEETTIADKSVSQAQETISDGNIQNNVSEDVAQEEKISITFNADMHTIEIRLENETEETKNILKQNGYTYLSFAGAYVTDNTWEARQFLKEHYSKWLESAA